MAGRLLLQRSVRPWAPLLRRRGESTSTSSSTSAPPPVVAQLWDVHEPFAPRGGKAPRWTTAAEAVRCITSGCTVFVHGGAATPLTLVDAMVHWGKEAPLRDVRLVSIHTEGEAAYNAVDCQGIFRSNNLFISANARKAVNEGRADYTPIFLSEIPQLFRQRIIPIDVALVQVSPPDKHGFMSLGVSVDIARAALQSAKIIVGLVNRYMPRSHGDGIIHQTHFDAVATNDTPLPELPRHSLSPEEMLIGQHIAGNLVDDGATLQMGIGAVPDAVLAKLGGHKNLGIHTEMFSDGVIELVENGVVTNSEKVISPGKITSSFVIGSRKVFDFLDDNPLVEMRDIAFVNNTAVIRQNPKVCAINSAIEVDLTGQVVSDSIGTTIYSGVGGQMDFIRGASLSPGGRPIIALPSTTRKGESRIVPFVREGAGIVTTRAHVHYVVTEYGIASLYGRSLRERAEQLVRIAHPSHREALERAMVERRWRSP